MGDEGQGGRGDDTNKSLRLIGGLVVQVDEGQDLIVIK